VAHEFLSDDWVEAAQAIRAKYADDAPPMPYKIRMNQIITGAPFTDDEVHLYLDTSDGTMKMGKGHLDDPEVTVTMDWETARKIFVDGDQAAGMQAFMSGKIKVDGDMTKLMMMNAAPPDDVARRVAAEIKEITRSAPE
jgi:putative sterol carrier protein